MANENQHTVVESIARASERSLGMFLVGSVFGLTWGLARGTGALWTYPLFIGGNCAFVSLPCFAVREIIGPRLPDPAASLLSGAIGGFGAMHAYSGIRSAPKGAIVFGLAGLGLERANQAFQDYKAIRREELLEERLKANKTNS